VKEDFKDDKEFKKALKEYKKKTAQIHTDNNTSINKRTTFDIKINMATELREREFYIPKNLDFRNRVYDMSVLLNNQSDDLTKSLIMFRNGKKLGKDGFFWQKVNIANLCGIADKEDFSKRVKWTEDNTEAIKKTIENIKNGVIDDFWYDDKGKERIDKPYQFIAAALEYVEVIKQDNPDEYVTYIDCQLDGTCSGLQHYSALLLDEIGGSYVNLLESDKPQDVYGRVAKTLIDKLNNIDELNKINFGKNFNKHLIKSFSMNWSASGHINRSFCKKGVMTTVYSITLFGILIQLREYLNNQIEKGSIIDETFLGKDSMAFINKVFNESINETLLGAAKGMEYIKNMVSTFYSEDINKKQILKFITPLGFTISHNYKKLETRRVSTNLGNLRYQPSLEEEALNNEADKSKNVSAIAPNFIHSLDATHLIMSINKMNEKYGTTDFKVIHDSFATHYCDTGKFHRIIKEMFVELYSEDRLENLKQDIIKCSKSEKVNKKISDMTIKKGNLKIEDVLKSDFLFS
jgi:DNA-directed RNA polymerase